MSNKGMDRRNFLKVGGMSTLALTLGTTGLLSLTNASKSLAAGSATNPTSGFGGYGPLVKDPNGILDLPKGFHYKMFSKAGVLCLTAIKFLHYMMEWLHLKGKKTRLFLLVTTKIVQTQVYQ